MKIYDSQSLLCVFFAEKITYSFFLIYSHKSKRQDAKNKTIPETLKWRYDRTIDKTVF